MSTDNRPLVVLAGPINAQATALLESEARVVVAQDLTESGVVQLAQEAEGIIFRSRPDCSFSLMAACPKLKVVGRHGAGLDIVDVSAATRLGVAVVHSPGANAPAVAEHALMLMLMCAKRAVQVDRWTRDGDWRARADAKNEELGGKTLGIVGVGNIGRRVAGFGKALGMRVLAYDKYLADDEVRRRGAEPTASLEALLPQVDVLTCHTPLTEETRAMINPRTLGLMKRGAILVNTSRGPVHDERAVFEALATGRLGAAGLDVFNEEPSPVDNPIFGLPTLVCSQHVAGVTVQANLAVGTTVVSEMLRVLRGERPEVLVNPDVWPRLGRR
jgi:D-3-phosphoglycerate dehydrogenase / 2-oxoglutarate reductase